MSPPAARTEQRQLRMDVAFGVAREWAAAPAVDLGAFYQESCVRTPTSEADEAVIQTQ